MKIVFEDFQAHEVASIQLSDDIVKYHRWTLLARAIWRMLQELQASPEKLSSIKGVTIR